jgi:hypothetical protein
MKNSFRARQPSETDHTRFLSARSRRPTTHYSRQPEKFSLQAPRKCRQLVGSSGPQIYSRGDNLENRYSINRLVVALTFGIVEWRGDLFNGFKALSCLCIRRQFVYKKPTKTFRSRLGPLGMRLLGPNVVGLLSICKRSCAAAWVSLQFGVA